VSVEESEGESERRISFNSLASACDKPALTKSLTTNSFMLFLSISLNSHFLPASMVVNWLFES
jgi:hypothetical protein